MNGHRIVSTIPAPDLHAIVADPHTATVVRVVALAIVEDVLVDHEGGVDRDTPTADYRDRTLEPVIVWDGCLQTERALAFYECLVEMLPPGVADADADELEQVRRSAAHLSGARKEWAA